MKVTLTYRTETEIRTAATFCAQLVRDGVQFHAETIGESMLITFTGGY